MVTLSSYGQKPKIQFTPSHEIRLAGGIITPNYGSSYFYNGLYGNSPFDDYHNAQNYWGSERSMFGGLSLEYKYNILRWFSFGASVSYERLQSNRYDRITELRNQTNTSDIISVIPMAKFQYLTSEFVTLYSQVGVGLSVDMQTIKEDNKSTRNYTNVMLTGQFTAIGVTVGKSLFGFAEIGAGSQGTFKIGIGYKFKK